MKTFTYITLAVLLVIVCGGCSDSDEMPSEPLLPVTANNLAGVWRLKTWQEAERPAESFVYIEFIRKDQRFRLYQNLDSFGPVQKSGRFAITTDEHLGAILHGEYDFSYNQQWNNRYVVHDLTQHSMTWVAVGNEHDISVYERCEALPSEIESLFPNTDGAD